MAMYWCKGCDQLIDDDWFPMNEKEECPSCDEKNDIDSDTEHTACQSGERQGDPKSGQNHSRLNGQAT